MRPGSTRAPFSANTSVSTWSMSSWTDSMTLRKSSTTWSAIACSTAEGPFASWAGSDSSPSRSGPSEPCLPCRTVTTKSGPANTMISPVLTTSLVAVSSSCST